MTALGQRLTPEALDGSRPRPPCRGSAPADPGSSARRRPCRTAARVPVSATPPAIPWSARCGGRSARRPGCRPRGNPQPPPAEAAGLRRAAPTAGSSRMPATSAGSASPSRRRCGGGRRTATACTTWRTTISSVHDPRLLLDRAEAQDRGLARVDDRRAAVDAERPDVGDRERAAAHLGRLRLALARGRGQLVERAGQLEQREVLGVLDVGHDQPARGGRGDAEVDVAA